MLSTLINKQTNVLPAPTDAELILKRSPPKSRIHAIGAVPGDA